MFLTEVYELKVVIVESPAKAETISRFLGADYQVVASYGHIRDLPSSADEVPEEIKSKPWATMAVDTDNGFTPVYVVTKESKRRISELKKIVKNAEEVILATDEDREGESISWHLLETLQPKAPVKRIAFHEITKTAIEEALRNPRGINYDLVRAQESRRVLDRLYGYSLSPLLWKKVRPKLSAGRVQSVAIRLVVEREEERKAFILAEYWNVEAELAKEGIQFGAALVSLDGKRPAAGKDFDGKTGLLKHEGGQVVHILAEDAERLRNLFTENLPWRVARVEQKETRQRPQPPFITSTLQQAASSLLNMPPRRTMQVAQALYEGVDLGSGVREGLITYMRTDSLTLSGKALQEAGEVIKRLFGEKFYNGPRRYATKSKNAQEAHEAIRPTHLDRTPDQLKPFLSKEELALYRIIWNRAIASQMADATLMKTVIDFEVEAEGVKAGLRSNGSVVAFPGYLKVADVAQKDTVLPQVEEGERVGPSESIQLLNVASKMRQTQPPSRYTEASLIQRLEEEEIGRPSTYAPTITTIEQRGYVMREGKALAPTFLAVAVVSLLRKHFQEYVDLGFTARMEDALDEISNGRLNSTEFLSGFYRGNDAFGKGLAKQIEHELPRIEFPAIPVGLDPESGESIVVRLGRNAPFLQRGEAGSGKTAPVPNDVSFEELTVDKALELLRVREQTNEALGVHPETGEKIYAQLGPYGPYVQLGEATESKKKPKRASLPKGMKLEEVDIAVAVRLLSLPRELGADPGTGETITASVGRFGPYVKRGSDFRSLGKDDDVYTVELSRALELLSQPKRSRTQTKKVLRTLGEHPESGKTIELCDGRYGPFVTDGEVNASLPRGADPESYALTEAVELIAQAASKKTTRKKTASKKTTAKKTASKKTAAKKTRAKKSSPDPEETPSENETTSEKKTRVIRRPRAKTTA